MTPVEFLADNPLVLLFLVAGIGTLVGRVRVGDFSLGAAAVLFVGLVAGGIDSSLVLPEIVYILGLVLFVYTIGLGSGPGFVRALRGEGLRALGLVAGLIGVGFVLTVVVAALLDLNGASAAGLFSGSLTNTPALAAVVQYLRESGEGASAPVVAYSLAYPAGVVGMTAAIYLLQRWWRVDYREEDRRASMPEAAGEPIAGAVVRVTRGDGVLVGDLAGGGLGVLVTRVSRDGTLIVGDPALRLKREDLVNVIGSSDQIQAAVERLGEPSSEPLTLDRTSLDMRRIFVSDPHRVGVPVGSLGLLVRFGAMVTRVRRGDIDFIARDDTALELGDRVRVVAPRERMREVTEFFGDSYKASGEVDVTTFGLGIAIGLLIGSLSIPLPGGATFTLGIAGGPLIAGLVLGWLERTGPLTWQLPYNASSTLRQVGLVMFLAGIGTRSGDAMFEVLSKAESLQIVLGGAFITCTVAVTTLVVGHRLLRLPMGLLTGALAGLQTQPAVLAFAVEQAGDELPNVGYATVYPVAMIAKIALAQVILIAVGY